MSPLWLSVNEFCFRERENMINSREDYLYYLNSDKKSLGIKRKRPRIFGDEIWKFERLLRKMEYYINCKRSIVWKPFFWLMRLRFHRLSMILSFEIPFNVVGPGISLAHKGILVSPGAKIGKNCRIHDGVNIGTEAGYDYRAPIIGDNVYIGPGVKMYGKIEIASGITIGANAVVNKSFTEPNISIAGVPAIKISSRGSKGLMFTGAD